MVEKEVNQDYLREILAALGAKDMADVAEDRDVSNILVTKESLEGIVGAYQGEEDVSLGNELLYLRDRDVVNVTERRGDLFVGIQYNQTRPDRLSFTNDGIDYPSPEPEWANLEEPEFEIDDLYPTIAQAMIVVADETKRSGKSRVTPEKVHRIMGRSGFEDRYEAMEAVHYTLNLLTEADRLLMDASEEKIEYVPNSEYIGEFDRFYSHRMQEQGPVYQIGREFSEENMKELEDDGVELFDDLEQYAG